VCLLLNGLRLIVFLVVVGGGVFGVCCCGLVGVWNVLMSLWVSLWDDVMIVFLG